MQAPSPISGRKVVAMLLIPSFTFLGTSFFVSSNSGYFEKDVNHYFSWLVSEESMVQIFEFVVSSKIGREK